MLRPLRDKIIVEPLENEDVSPGGIHIPDKAKGRPRRGRVIAVGDGKVMDNGVVVPCECKPGDIVFFGEYSGQPAEIDGTNYQLFWERDILAILTNE